MTPSRFIQTKSQLISIGLTGGIGSGKTTVSKMFGARGAILIDTDSIAHKISAPGGIAITQIQSAFGSNFITPEGAMDRNRMRAHVFTNYASKTLLESILHPLIYTETIRIASLAKNITYLILIVPLLIESRQWQHCITRTLVIDCKKETQIVRVMRRNNMTRKQVNAILENQITRTERLIFADDIIENNSEKTALIPQVKKLHTYYLSLTKKNV